jgi:hypothetical protein
MWLIRIPISLIFTLIDLGFQIVDYIKGRKQEKLPETTPEYERWLDKLEQIREEKVEEIRVRDPGLAMYFDEKTKKIMVVKRRGSKP